MWLGLAACGAGLLTLVFGFGFSGQVVSFGVLAAITLTIGLRVRQPARVIVKENLYRWVNWQITESSDRWEKQDYRTVHFPIEVPAGGEKKVTYSVKYWW